MFWYTGACTLTGNAPAHTHSCSYTNRIITYYVWFHFFNSYDSWLSSGDVEGEVEEAPHSEKLWRVSTAAHIQKHDVLHFIYLVT